MTAALSAIIHQWAIPRMGARKIRATSFEGNLGSVRVMEKNGFALVKTMKDCIEVWGERRSLHVLEWTLDKR